METRELKPPLTLDQQIDLLISRGLLIVDRDLAAKILGKVNYYRLSAYSLGLRKDDIFHEGTSFSQIYQLYEFDAKFRQVLMGVIESIEVAYRTKIAYYLAIKHGALSYLNSTLFSDSGLHAKMVIEFEAQKEQQKNAAFVKHHNRFYGGTMPVWVAIEIFSFGMLSKLYGNIRPQLQRDFVRSYLHKPKEYTPCLPSWLKSMVEVRNICAHYGRIYNRTLTSMPAMLPQYKHSVIPKNRIFSVLLFMILMLDDYSKSTSLILNIKNLIEEYDAVDMNLIGFPLNWESLLNNAR